MKRIFAYAAMATLGLGMSYPASAQVNDYTLHIYFYSDATYSQEVGYARPYCTRTFAGATMQYGYSTQYKIEYQGPLCVNGELQPD